MGRNPPTTYIIAVEEARGMKTRFQLTTLQQRRNGNSSNMGGEHKRVHQEGGEPSQQPSFKKSKGNQLFQKSSNSKQLGAQSFSGQHNGNSSFMRPIPRQSLICFKCGKPHRASECGFSGTCNTRGKVEHVSMVCIFGWIHHSC